MVLGSDIDGRQMRGKRQCDWSRIKDPIVEQGTHLHRLTHTGNLSICFPIWRRPPNTGLLHVRHHTQPV